MHYQRANPAAPWLTATAIEFLSSWLRPSDVGLEWGCGRSTIWLAHRVAQVVSVEDNREWADRVSQLLTAAGLSGRVELSTASSDTSTGTAEGSPYVAIANRFRPSSFDFCLVDGTHRDHCALAAIDLVKPGGLLLVDNAERYLPRALPSSAPGARSKDDGTETSGWAKFESAISNWRGFWTSNGVFDTAIWIKPPFSEPITAQRNGS